METAPLRPRASILAVGTELTTGQITNRNAAWISERLTDLGLEVALHETVADDRARILEALGRCERAGSLIFVTGGLGPTTDDFTREVIASWCGKELRFDEPSWQRIVRRLEGFGIRVAESNRQQCYYPESSQVLENPQGTASGFAVSRGDATAFVLPGPPNEVAAVWEAADLPRRIRELCPGLRPLKLYTWQCIGKSEAELGELTESALQGSGLPIGYRAHRPYVEIKVWVPEEKLPEAPGWLAKLEEKIGPWIATRQGEDLAALLFRHPSISSAPRILIAEAGMGGALSQRLARELSRGKKADSRIEWAAPADPESWVRRTLAEAPAEAVTFAIAGFDPDGRGFLGTRGLGGGTGEPAGEPRAEPRIEPFRSPYRFPERLDIARQICCELALKRWREWL